MKQIDDEFPEFAGAWKSQLGCCLRGGIFDGWTREALARDPETLVEEIGAGLDTRYERVGGMTRRWVDLGLPDSMALRRPLIRENSRRRFVEGSVLDEGWIGSVKAMAEGHPAVFVAEGVLMYFSEADVKRLFGMLARHFPGSRLLFDCLGPVMVKHQARHDALTKTAARFTWSLDDVWEVERWGMSCILEKPGLISPRPGRHCAICCGWRRRFCAFPNR